MKTKKTYTQKNLLYQWVRIIQELYPKRRTQNLYIEQTRRITAPLSLEDKLLFHDILHCVTLINAESRRDEKGLFICSQTDLLNTVHMLCPPAKISEKVLNYHQKLHTEFDDYIFTYSKAERLLQVSHSTIKRILNTLIAHKMVIKLPETNYRTVQFKVLPEQQKETPIIEPTRLEESQESIFETMQGEWKDFQGFVEL